MGRSGAGWMNLPPRGPDGPSVHPRTGQVYRWHRGNDPHCLPYGPAQLPAWVSELDASEDCRRRDITHCVISEPRPAPRLIRIDGASVQGPEDDDTRRTR
jgi:hypothetical protein